MKTWKIYNKTDSDVKISVRVENTRTLGLFLKPKNFVVGMSSMTAQIDAQKRRGLIEIEDNFDNGYFQFTLGEQYERGTLEGLEKKRLDELKGLEQEALVVALSKTKTIDQEELILALSKIK